MSRVTITDLVPGTEATSANVNATLTSWNTAAAAGAIGENNFREEGIDRRSLSAAAQAIQYPPAAFGNCFAEGDTSSGPLSAAAYDVINVGTDLKIGPMTDVSTTANEKVMVRVSVWFAADCDLLLECIIQSSADAVTWTDYDESYQAFMIDQSSVDPPPTARCVGCYTSFVQTHPSGQRVYWRAAYQVTPGGGGSPGTSVEFQYGTIYIEEYAR